MPDPTRQRLEALWRSRVTDAKLRLEFARLFLKEVQTDLAADVVPVADGQFAFRQALRAENAALAEYNRVLRIYTDLTMNGTVPDEDAWHGRKSGRKAKATADEAPPDVPNVTHPRERIDTPASAGHTRVGQQVVANSDQQNFRRSDELLASQSEYPRQGFPSIRRLRAV